MAASLAVVPMRCTWSEWVSVTQSPAVTFDRTEGQGCGTFDVHTMTPIYAVRGCAPYPTEYLKAHEEAHGILINIGFFLGPSLMDQERAADVLAYLRTGYIGPYWPNGIDDESLLAAKSALESRRIDP